MKARFILRPAESGDVAAIAAMVARHVETGDVLPRSAENIACTLPDWQVAVSDPDGELLGCGSLWNYSASLAELRSIIVSESARGLGIGKLLVAALVDRAYAAGVTRCFTLTRAEAFFARCDFIPTNKDDFPEKIWKDCHLCPIRDHCDEIAMIHSKPMQSSGPESEYFSISDLDPKFTRKH